MGKVIAPQVIEVNILRVIQVFGKGDRQVIEVLGKGDWPTRCLGKVTVPQVIVVVGKSVSYHRSFRCLLKVTVPQVIQVFVEGDSTTGHSGVC